MILRNLRLELRRLSMKKRINEGGNIFKNADGQPDTIRINRVDVEPTVQLLETI